jgi:hypothetical protein
MVNKPARSDGSPDMLPALPWFRDILFLIIPLPAKLIKVGKYADEAYRKRLRNGPNKHVSRDLFSYLFVSTRHLTLNVAHIL